MILLAVDMFKISYLLFLYKVLQDLQETLEFEIFGATMKSDKNSMENDNNNKETISEGIQY